MGFKNLEWIMMSLHQWADFDDLYVMHPHKEVPFGVSFTLLPILGSNPPKIPYFGGVNRHICKILKLAYYQNYCTNSN